VGCQHFFGGFYESRNHACFISKFEYKGIVCRGMPNFDSIKDYGDTIKLFKIKWTCMCTFQETSYKECSYGAYSCYRNKECIIGEDEFNIMN
jgi:hypothetical protein